MSSPARPLPDAQTPRASEYTQRHFAHLNLTPEQLAAEDLELTPPMTEEEREAYLLAAASWATPEQLDQLRIELTPLTDEARAELLAAVDEAPISEASRASFRRDLRRA